MKNSFATSVVPTLVAAPVTPTANGMISLTPEQLNKAITDAVAAAMASFQAPAAAPVTPAKAPKARKTPVTTTVNVTPVVAPTAKAAPKSEHRGTGIGFFSTGKVCMLTCQDGSYNATATVPPAGEQFPVLFLERAIMKDGQAVVLPEETRTYTATKAWKRNSKNTGWISCFPKKIA